MRKLERLRKEALGSCKFRGHKMKRFKKIYNGIAGITTYSHCIVCGKQVVILSKPRPNDIEVSGEAVALSCED